MPKYPDKYREHRQEWDAKANDILEAFKAAPELDSYSIEDISKEMTTEENVIYLYRAFVEIFRDLNIAAVASRIFSWSSFRWKNGAQGWYYCTYEQWDHELALEKKVVIKATNYLVKHGLIEKSTRKVSGSPTNHYRILPAKWLKLFVCAKTALTKVPKPPERKCENDPKESSKTAHTYNNNQLTTYQRTTTLVAVPSPPSLIESDRERMLRLIPDSISRSDEIRETITDKLANKGEEYVASNIEYAKNHHDPHKGSLGGMILRSLQKDFAYETRVKAAEKAKIVESRQKEQEIEIERQRQEDAKLPRMTGEEFFQQSRKLFVNHLNQ